MSKDNMMHSQRVTRYNLTIAFEELYCLGDRKCRGQRDQNVDVVASSPYSQCFHFILLGDATKIRPEPTT